MHNRSTTIQNFKANSAPSLERAQSVLPKSFHIEVVNPNSWRISYPEHYCYNSQGDYTGGHIKYLNLLCD